jgi:hypothetical protein
MLIPPLFADMLKCVDLSPEAGTTEVVRMSTRQSVKPGGRRIAEARFLAGMME